MTRIARSPALRARYPSLGALDAFGTELAEDFIRRELRDEQLIDVWLAKLAGLTGVDRVTLWEFCPEGEEVLRYHSFTVEGQAAVPQVLAGAQFGWLKQQNRDGKIVAWSRMPDDIPRGAASEREYGLRIGCKSLLSIPVRTQSSLSVLAFVSLRRPKRWSAAVVRRLRVVSSILAVAAARDRSERSLSESEERFRGAFEHSRVGMALVGDDGRWIRVNASLCRMLGYTEDELMARSFQQLTYLDDLGLNLEQFQRALRGEIDHYELEKRYVHKSGAIVPALLTVSVVRDPDRRLLYFVSQLYDLSERQRAQHEIHRLGMELSHFGRLAVMGKLTASLAHQLSQPIMSARLNAEACQALIKNPPALQGVIDAALEDIVLCCERATEVIRDVRGMLRKESAPRERVNLNRVISELVEVTRSDMLVRGVRLAIDLDDSMQSVQGSRIQLQQVILNVLLNAAEALEHTEGVRNVQIATRSAHSGVEVVVRDNGSGTQQIDLVRIFEPFVTTKPNGMGMGLAICSDIVRAHGGRIWAEPNVPNGITVRCFLPASA
ncbi:MAG TPA: PAS domain S-box protein [Steroidobacteraceae bacterium]|jgi:PAS domain S-box-containing protein